MSIYSGDYKNFWESNNGAKYAFCSRDTCTSSIEKWSDIEVCENKHIFHQKCWKGVCSHHTCKAIKEAKQLEAEVEAQARWERGAPERERQAEARMRGEANFALVAGVILIGLLFLSQTLKYLK